ncbi:Golgi apparatus membrane protein TVP23 homolog A isoform X1 [Oryzias latipes]|uniref:Golgi apparatus membrane protein TVP23 homolog A isoform X1 n=1 Tax=Oryzias latipes TaxID=8090 RepID=UPI0002A4B0E9|nr:Golgi apparatus membrane protein TVP23 homolog A isoform X1 [Oryzias latipes]
MADDTVEVELNLDTDDEEQEIARRGAVFRQPLASFLHLFFRLVALVMYLLCDWDGKNFESCFFTIIGLLSLDFWYVKNVSGRLLVGLHWWNQIDEDGNSFWVFEAKKRSPNTGTQTEARIFWLGLIICPLIWTIFFFTALFSLKIEWLLLVIPCFSLQVVNLHCYLRCKAGEQNGQLTCQSSNTQDLFLQRPNILFGFL